MTDMTIGVLFIFIIMLSYFALQYRRTTAALTKAKDPETKALLTLATALQNKDVQVGIDYEHRVVCIPTTALSANGQADSDTPKRCFAYSAVAPTNAKQHQSAEERSSLVSFVSSDLMSAHVENSADAPNGGLHFNADKLFNPGTAVLSAEGQTIALQVAASLAARLPCFGYGVPSSGCNGAKLADVNVISQSSFDAFTEDGQKAAALGLQRAVAFHRALTSNQPVLGKIRSAPPGTPGSQPLLRVANIGQSQEAAPAGGANQSISLQFDPAS